MKKIRARHGKYGRIWLISRVTPLYREDGIGSENRGGISESSINYPDFVSDCTPSHGPIKQNASCLSGGAILGH